jgi:hypothetical protein
MLLPKGLGVKDHGHWSSPRLATGKKQGPKNSQLAITTATIEMDVIYIMKV